MVAFYQIGLSNSRSQVVTVIALVVLVASICNLLGPGCCANESQGVSDTVVEHNQFDVVIAGGSTAAFAAAIAAAESGAKTALLEPTNWVGGQLTSSGVPAVDEAWHTVMDKKTEQPLLSVSRWARDPRNITPNFFSSLEGMQDCGDCWVSRFCFRPRIYLKQQLEPMLANVEVNLIVFRETVVKQVEVNDSRSRVRSIVAIQRFPREGLAANGYDVLPSQDLADWYSATRSDRFAKQVHRFTSKDNGSTVFIDATEWGEVLALSGADFLQGVEDVDGQLKGDSTCGQATVYCFVQEILAEPVKQTEHNSQVSGLGYGDYREKENAWERIWTYRRIKGEGKPAPGDLCLQNWGYSKKLGDGGNDYPFDYVFKSKEETAAEFSDWQGGINLRTLALAEQRAFGWHHWFRQHAPPDFHPDQFRLAGDELGTDHGLAKLPYIRDTRRSIGIDDFVLKFADLTGPAEQKSGTHFPDSVALGAYAADIHPLSNCKYPKYVFQDHHTLPFYVPFRALTHYEFENLLVAGKTMAQSFLANSATRLHPIEWSSGTAAGVSAAYMAQKRITSRQALRNIEELRALIGRSNATCLRLARLSCGTGNTSYAV